MVSSVKSILRALGVVAGVFATQLAAASQVQLFSPQGEAKNVRQVTARFSEPMVAFGDPRLPDPFTVQCDGDPARLKGRGRWADARNWIYDFESDLAGGQRCRFAVKADAKALSGKPIEGKREFSFHTGGPAIVASRPRDDDESIDEEQVFILALDAPIDTGSLEGAWCEAAGIGERIALKVVSEKETREILNANKDDAYNLFSAYFTDNMRVPFARFKIEDKRWSNLPVVGVRCARRLPSGADVKLVLGPQVKTRTGIECGKPQQLAFKVRPAFVVKLTCDRANKDAACLPVTPIRLAFTAPVARDLAEGVRLKAKDGAVRKPTLETNVNTVESVEFTGPFPEKMAFLVELPRGFKDDAGREPENKSAFPLATATDEYPPLAKFPGRFGILELNADPLLPVTVRNVEKTLRARRGELPAGAAIPGRAARLDDETQIIQRSRSYMRNEHMQRAQKALKRYPNEGEIRAIAEGERAVAFEVPRAHADKDMKVIGIPLKKPGYYIVELASPRLGQVLHGEDKPYYVSTSVLVTNLAVHLKHGRESSLVWVTSLDRGKPVADAQVTIRDCSGSVLFEGRTDASGIANAGDALPARDAVRHCGDHRRMLIAFARAGDDLSFTYSDWGDGISPWNFNFRAESGSKRTVSIHTIFDRPLFRAGETVSMKHLARARTGSGFRVPPVSELPAKAELEHIGSGQKYPLQTSFDGQGIAESTWRIPAEAKLGTYNLRWIGRDTGRQASFRVEAFRVPLMRAVLAQPKDPQVRPAKVLLDAAVTYLAGGPAPNLPIKVRYRVETRGIEFGEYSDFRFGGRPVKEGVERGSLADLWETVDPDAEDKEVSAEVSTSTSVRNLTLDPSGTAKIAVDKLPTIDRAANLLVEMEYSDPNGEVLAVASRVPLHPAGLYVGIKPEGWAASKKSVRAQVVAVDPAGKPLANRAVSVDVYERKTFSNRRRLVGGFYAFDSTTETKRLSGGCSGTTEARAHVLRGEA